MTVISQKASGVSMHIVGLGKLTLDESKRHMVDGRACQNQLMQSGIEVIGVDYI
jgi:hypothetical protein